MGAKTNYLENALVNHIFRGTAFTAPTTLALALATAVADAKAGSFTECANAGGYQRKSLTPAVGLFDAPTAGQTANTNAITFDNAPTADWGTVTHLVITDDATYGGGNPLFIQALAQSQQILSGQAAPSFAAGAITYDEDTV